MEFLEKTFDHAWTSGFILEPTWVTRLSELIRDRIDIWSSFAIYQWSTLQEDANSIVWHAWEYRWELLAPVVSNPEDPYNTDSDWSRLVYMLDVNEERPKIIQIPTWIPLVGMRDSYRYHCSLNKFFTAQTVEQILTWLREDGYQDFVYVKRNWPMDFTSISTLLKHIVPLDK